MSHGPEHQIEHAEHAVHASHDAFNKNVTMSIAIVAAVLACVTMLGHRSHNETLRLQGEALSLQTEANIKSTQFSNKAAMKTTETANKWAYYQTKNLTNNGSMILLDSISAGPKGDHQNSKEHKDVVTRHEKNVEYYTGDKDTRGDRGKDRKASTEDEAKKPSGQLAKIKKIAEDLENQTDETIKKGDEVVEAILQKSKATIHASHVEHMKAARLDYGELALQLAVVLCSLAILTKNRSFWFSGIACGVLGALIAVSAELGIFMGEHH